MNNFTKLIALFLAIVTLVSAAVACNSDPQSTPSDTTGITPADTTTEPLDTTDTEAVDTTTAPDTDETETTAPPVVDEIVTPETITIEKNRNSLNYVITRPRAAASDSSELLVAQQLLLYFSEKIGARATVVTDWAKNEDPERLEIIVGATDHPETSELLYDMSYGDYAVRAIGNKLIVIASDKDGYDKAVSYLIGVLDNGYDKDAKIITVSTSELSKLESTNKQLSALPVYEGGTYYATYDAGRVTAGADCDEIIIKSTTSEEYDEYLEKLSARGYTQYTTNNIGNNKFAIYTNDKYTLNVGYYDYEKSARLLVEPKGALPTLAEDNDSSKEAKITDSQMTMIAVSSGNENIGLSMLIRLEDGRFIVVDGAGSRNLDHFVRTIKKQAAEYTNKPIIAAWIITHGHSDHGQLLSDRYSNIKSSGITVESIILNEVSTSDPTSGGGYGYTKKIIEGAAPTLGADLYKAHVGQTFHISNCKLEVMFSQEANAPNTCIEYNSTSIIIKMTFTDSETGKETTYLSTGDATGFGMQTACNIFGDYMKCDIMNVNHHGLGCSGGNTELAESYKLVAPALVLWPIGNGGVGISGKLYNQVIFGTSSFREVYFAGNIGGSDVVVPLPYVVGNVIRVDQNAN